MAVVKNPALSMAASGNLGGICYASHGGLAIARGAWTGTVPNTADQQVIQAFMTSVSQAWGGTLTATDRQAWEEGAQTVRYPSRLGDQIKLSGYNYFVKFNMVRKVMGLAILTLPIIDSKNPLAISLQVSNAILHTHVDVNFLSTDVVEDGVFVDADKYQIFRAGPYTSGGRHALDGEYRQIAIADPGIAYHDTSPEDQKYYWYKARSLLNSGKVGNFHEAQIFVEEDPAIFVDLLCWIIWNVGTGPVNVPLWPDQTVNNNDYTAIGVGIPTKTATGVEFDGTSDFMTNDNVFFTSPMWQREQDFTVIVVIKPEVISSDQAIIALGQTTDNATIGVIQIVNNVLEGGEVKDRIQLRVRDTTNNDDNKWISDNTVEVIGNEIQIWTVVQLGSGIKIYKNDSENAGVLKDAGPIGGAAFHNEKTLIGKAQINAGDLWFFDGEIQEELVWDRALNAAERTAVILDLMQQYNIT